MKDINTMMEKFLTELLETGDIEGSEKLASYLKEKDESLSKSEVRKLFYLIVWDGPAERYWLPTAKEMANEVGDITELNTPFRKMLERKYFESIGFDISTIKEGAVYTCVNNDSKPTAVVFTKAKEQYMDFCDVYALDTNTTMSVNISSLTPFDVNDYESRFRKWEIAEHKAILKNLEAGLDNFLSQKK